MVNGYKERMGKIEGGEERFYKKIDSPILKEMYLRRVYKFYYRTIN